MRLNVIGFALGVWLLQTRSDLPAYGWLAIAPFLALAALWCLTPRNTALQLAGKGLSFVLCAACGFAWAAWRADLRLADELPAAWEGRDLEIVGVVASLPQPYERSLRFEFDVERVLTGGAQVPAHIVLSWWGSPARDERPATVPELRPGERWQLKARLRRPHGTSNPHGFDYEGWLFERDIRATGYVRPNAANRRITDLVARPAYLVERLRANMRERMHAALPAAPYAGVLIALAIGDQRAIPPEQWRVFTRTGVNHLMSISGLHVTMIAGLVFAVTAWLWRRSARLLLRLPARKAAAASGLLAALAYSWLAGFGVPAQRTVYMLAVVALALWLGRTGSASVVLAAALAFVLVLDPWAVLSPGFWLSFGAVGLILYVGTARIGRGSWLVEWARIQWAVTLGLIPFLLALFQQVSLVSPLANALAIPLVSFAVVPLALIGNVLPGDFGLELAHGVMALCMIPLEWLSGLPDAVWQQHAPVPWTIPVAVAGVLWLLLPSGFPARWIGAGALLPLFLAAPPPLPHGALAVTILDVGQGLAVVARTKEHALLYDAGPAFGPGADSGNRIIVPFLRAAGVRSLAGMLISHDGSDHSGGAPSVLQAVPVGWLSSSLPDGHALRALEVEHRRCETGQSWQWDGVDFEVIHPAAWRYEHKESRHNDRSCVVKISAGPTSVLITSDIEQKSEREMLAALPDRLRADVLVIPHHGSRTSSSETFVNGVRPHIAIATVGYRNRFGHPKEDVLDRYRALGSRIFRTDRDGALLLGFDGKGSVTIERHRSLDRRYWQSPVTAPESAGDPAI